ncbi:high mobility group B protein 14 [Diospyros lotus]|uniref:high mobility group B protein 14 n=1 Tax=Diospyros lotus TaxID=55363 RepID=UPI002259C9D3|nr:high mobility group B protein 14 [Diospyros lotus]
MAKKAPKARKSASASTSSSTENPDGKEVLRLKSAAEIHLRRPNSAKKSKATLKKKPGKVDAKKPKKPPTAFFYFLEDFRKGFQEQNPDVKSMRDIGKACGEKWKTMTYEEKVQYYDIATEKRAEFDRAMSEYNKRKESGEDKESEDSEFDG